MAIVKISDIKLDSITFIEVTSNTWKWVVEGDYDKSFA